jgi:2-octaprenylphenol hydroxylase
VNPQFDVIIVGGGVVGLTAALAMAQRHYTVAILDAGELTVDTPRPDLRVYAINKASESLLTQLDVWPHLDATRLSPYQKMHVWDGVNGAHIDFDARAIATPNLGSILEESLLKYALLKQIAACSNIHLFAHSPVDRVEHGAHAVTIHSQNRCWQGQLLMVADGANSPMRQHLKVDITSWSYKQQAIVAMVETEKPHQHTAYQVFNPDGPLAFLPLANPHHCSIVWSTETRRAQQLMNLNDPVFNTELTNAFGSKLGQVSMLSSRHHFPLHMRHAKQYSGTRWLLLGDAAHTIHPLAGLGLNVGLADITAWLACLDRNKNTLVSNKVLQGYQRERKHAVWQIIVLMEAFKRGFSPSLLPITSLRGLGLRACNELTFIKRLFIQHAAGLNL